MCGTNVLQSFLLQHHLHVRGWTFQDKSVNEFPKLLCYRYVKGSWGAVFRLISLHCGIQKRKQVTVLERNMSWKIQIKVQHSFPFSFPTFFFPLPVELRTYSHDKEFREIQAGENLLYALPTSRPTL